MHLEQQQQVQVLLQQEQVLDQVRVQIQVLVQVLVQVLHVLFNEEEISLLWD